MPIKDENPYEKFLIQAAAQWVNQHKDVKDRINQIRPELEVLRDALTEVLEDIESN